MTRLWNYIVECLVLVSCFRTSVSTATTRETLACALPIADVALNASPFLTVQSDMKIHCLRTCVRYNCVSFNFGMNVCELFDSFLCQDVGSLENRPGYTHYDVENATFAQLVDEYKHLTACTVLGRCSPKCYQSTTGGTSTSTTTTTTPAPTTTTTAAPSSTTTTAPSSTTTEPSSTTTAPSSTTAAAPSTTTTAAQSTTTSTPVDTTTSVATSTTASVPIFGEVFHNCSYDGDCHTNYSDCRNGLICECIAGYSHHNASKACLTICPDGFGNTFHKTEDYYLYGLNLVGYTFISRADCHQHCEDNPECASFEYDTLLNSCTLSSEVKTASNIGSWLIDPFYEYHQRNCA